MDHDAFTCTDHTSACSQPYTTGNYEQQLHAEGHCAEIVSVWTEDGPTDGRCMDKIVSNDEPMCEGHLREYREWREMTEFEKMEWEYNQSLRDF